MSEPAATAIRPDRPVVLGENSREHDLPENDGQCEYLAIARVLAPHGVGGAFRAEILTDFPERFAVLKIVYVGPQRNVFHVESARLHRRRVLFKLLDVDGVDAAERLRGQIIAVARADAVALAKGQYFWHQILGMVVVTPDGETLGSITEIIRTGSNDVYVVQSGEKTILIPAIEDVVSEVDLPRRRMIVELLPGMVE